MQMYACHELDPKGRLNSKNTFIAEHQKYKLTKLGIHTN